MTRTGVVLTGLLLFVLVAVGVIVGLRITQPPLDTPDRTLTGYYSPGDAITVQNLTIGDGRYRIGYSMEVLYSPLGSGDELRCGLADTSGRIEFFDEAVRDVPAGEWTQVAFNAVLELPELTLGLECSPSRAGLLSVVFRSVSLYAVVPSIFEND
jgi:hypothetical protein